MWLNGGREMTVEGKICGRESSEKRREKEKPGQTPGRWRPMSRDKKIGRKSGWARRKRKKAREASSTGGYCGLSQALPFLMSS